MKYRLVTRSDFDGLVCAVLLRHLDMIDEITFVHPKDVQDGTVEVTDRDILTNLPYDPGARIRCSTTTTRRRCATPATGRTTSSTPTPRRRPGSSTTTSAARQRFPEVSDELMRAVDQADSARVRAATTSSSRRAGRC